jgi:hypothetical protein
MFKIYKIYNSINNFIYIGQTTKTLVHRFSIHRNLVEIRNGKLYEAFRMIGFENFSIELIEECQTKEEADKLEYQYIQLFDSYNNGYNNTKDGSGADKIFNNYEDAILAMKKYKELKTSKAVAKYFGCDESVIMRLFQKYNFAVDNGRNVKPIKIIELDLNFPTIRDCAKYLIQNNITRSKNYRSVETGIHRQFIGKTSFYYGMSFEYL